MEISTAVAPPEGSHHDTRRENWDTTLPHQLSIYGRKNDHHKIISTLNLTSHYQHISCTRQLPEEGNTFGGKNCQPQWYQKLIIRHREKSHYFNQHSQERLATTGYMELAWPDPPVSSPNTMTCPIQKNTYLIHAFSTWQCSTTLYFKALYYHEWKEKI